MNPDLLPDEFWDWLQNGSPANNEVLGEIYKQFAKETDNRELVPVVMSPYVEGHRWTFIPLPNVQRLDDGKLVEDLEKELVDRINKRFKEEL